VGGKSKKNKRGPDSKNQGEQASGVKKKGGRKRGGTSRGWSSRYGLTALEGEQRGGEKSKYRWVAKERK